MTEFAVSEVDAEDQETLWAIERLRRRVWSAIVPEAAGTQSWLDRYDACARHWVARANGQLVAAARLSIHPTLAELPDAGDYEGVFTTPPPAPIASFNRLVVAPEARGNNLARQLDNIRLTAALQAGCRSVVGSTSSGDNRLRQLQAIGFVVIGERQRAPIAV